MKQFPRSGQVAEIAISLALLTPMAKSVLGKPAMYMWAQMRWHIYWVAEAITYWA